MIASASFKKEFNHIGGFKTANWILDNTNTGELFNQGDYEVTNSTENATVNGMVGLAYKIGSATTLTLNTLYNHSTAKESRFIFGERPDNLIDPIFLEGRSLSFREREMMSRVGRLWSDFHLPPPPSFDPALKMRRASSEIDLSSRGSC